MKILLVTEKCSLDEAEKDGGARLVETLQKAFQENLSIMQFGPKADPSATWHFNYPFDLANRFERRIANADFIAEKVKSAQHNFTHVIFIHISMQFGLLKYPLQEDIQIWTFPMFLTPSYIASGEVVPEHYCEIERRALANAKNILTPSHLEKEQLVELYSIPEEHIHVVPRGINTQLIDPQVRSLNGPAKFCSIGSIKPQKNTLGLVRLFAKVRMRFPESTLRIIGPIQNPDYFADVCREIQKLKLTETVEFTGYIPPSKLGRAIQDIHLHLSASTCETFGRSIFETLASGIPNIARKTGNAAAEFLEHQPYIRFVDNESETVNCIEEILSHLSRLSCMACEIGNLYDDEILSRLMVAKICGSEPLAISDFDGTLYHKEDPEKTLRCITAFRKFPVRILCSARPLHDLLDQLKFYNLDVDWIIGSSGAVVTNRDGKPLWITPIEPSEVADLEKLIPNTTPLEMEGQIVQIAIPTAIPPSIFGFRSEAYQGTTFIAHWQASKLHAVHRLLRHLNWMGQVRVFGDGPYDRELLTYFDGTLITPFPKNKFQKKEIEYV